MSGPKYRMALTPAQTVYLLELIEYDLEETALTKDEQFQARAIKRKLNEVLEVFKARGQLSEKEKT